MSDHIEYREVDSSRILRMGFELLIVNC